jgi:hypothetical protein
MGSFAPTAIFSHFSGDRDFSDAKVKSWRRHDSRDSGDGRLNAKAACFVLWHGRGRRVKDQPVLFNVDASFGIYGQGKV